MKRFDVINLVAEAIGAESYLEIGTQNGENMDRVTIQNKTGVDPNPNKVGEGYKMERMTSNAFFEKNKEKFDIIFIDGDHSRTQSKRDFDNAVKVRTENGVIILHDVNPQDEKYMGRLWCGEVYLTAQEIANEYNVVTYEGDHGVMSVMDKHNLPFASKIKRGQEFLDDRSDLNLVSNISDIVPFVNRWIKIETNGLDELEKDYVSKETDKIETFILSPDGRLEALEYDPSMPVPRSFDELTDEEIKDLYKEKFGRKPKGRFIRENVIKKINEA